MCYAIWYLLVHFVLFIYFILLLLLLFYLFIYFFWNLYCNATKPEKSASYLSRASTHLWHKSLLPNLFFIISFATSLYARSTRYASSQNFYMSRIRTNTGKQTVSYMGSIFWHEIRSYLKSLYVYQFSKRIKLYLSSEQLKNSIK